MPTLAAVSSQPLPPDASTGGNDTDDNLGHAATTPQLPIPTPNSARATAPDLVGHVLEDRYRIIEHLGSGGMGAVYIAEHIGLQKTVAIKMLLDNHADHDLLTSRLENEARLASSIGHKHIVTIIDVGTTKDGRTYVVMEYLEGESLGERLRRQGRLDEEFVIKVGIQVAGALEAAHNKGIIHRDIKPENIFVTEQDGSEFIKVLDFGISKAIASQTYAPRLTHTGMVLGTPLYMSPEQARGEDDIDHRADIYSLGVILYECLCGDVPFPGTNHLKILARVAADPAPPLTERVALTDKRLGRVVHAAMAKEVDDRYQSMRDVGRDLELLRDKRVTRTGERAMLANRLGPRKNARKFILWAGLVALVTISVVAILLATLRHSEVTVTPDATISAENTIRQTSIADARVVDKIDAVAQVSVSISTTPLRGNIYRAGRLLCQDIDPCTVEVERSLETVQFVATKPGYRDKAFTVRPQSDGGKVVKIVLEKPAPAAKNANRRKKTGNKPPKHDDTAGGDLTGDIYR